MTSFTVQKAIMKTILTLTDLSQNADHAALSSAIMIEKLHAPVFLYHTYYDSPLIGAYARGSMIIDEFSLLKKESVVKLNQLASSSNYYHSFICSAFPAGDQLSMW